MNHIVQSVLLSTVICSACLGVTIPASEHTAYQQARSSDMHMLLQNEDGIICEMDMDEYLVGAVLAEMPASFHPEALKAQAVAARTYAYKAYITGGKHRNGSICSNAGCCQSYMDIPGYLERYGTVQNVEKVVEAVAYTAGEVLTYEGELIEAAYFSCSGGRTESAESVWGFPFPYLQALDSPGEEESCYYEAETTLDFAEVSAAFEQKIDEDYIEPFQIISSTPGNGVDMIRIGETVYSGTEVRQKLGLRSTAFTIETDGNHVIFNTRGFGHRVGMSQYGADAMAKEGSSYVDILLYYYPGTTIERIL